MPMPRLASILFLAFLTIGLSAAGQPAPARGVELSETDRAELDRVSAYLNSITTLQADFVQIDPDGQMEQGRLYVEKPGRLRFEYNAPSPVLIVSDGRTVAVANTKLKTVDRYPLSSTPLGLIVGDSIDLAHNDAIVGVHHETGLLIVEARTSKNRNKPNLSMVFTDPEIELRQWTVLDDQGLQTTVALHNLEEGPILADSMFVLRDLKRAIGTKPRD